MKKIKVIGILAAMVIALVCCTKDGTNTNNNLNALPLSIASPADNPQTAQKIALGKLLFWDPILSGNKDVACGSCHHPSFGYSDGLDLSIGVNAQGSGAARHFILPNTIPFAKRNALSIVNSAFNGMDGNGNYDPATAAMFFDIRTRSLELQSLEPIKTMEEMRGRAVATTDILDTVIQRLKNLPQYVQLFNDAFASANAVTIQNLGKSIAAYERTIVSNHAPFDEYMRGNTSAMSAVQVQGMNAFTANGCNRCHSGAMFSDYSLHVLSVPDNTKMPTDAGANGTYAFRTPTLRNVTLTAPYMHSGVFNNLGEVMDFYERAGAGRSQNPHVADNQLDGNLRRINDRDKAAIIQFLGALTDPNFDKTIPTSLPSGLKPGGNL